MTQQQSTDGARVRRRAHRWSLRRRGVALGACLATALGGGGVAVAGTGGTTASGGSDSGAERTRSAHATVTLRPGSRGWKVKRLQRKLRITADGVYGRNTKRAVKRFQRRKRLTVDGIAGPATLRKLGLRFRSRRSARSRGSGVRIPAKLRRIAQCESGGNPRAVSPDGRYRGKYQFSMPTWRGLGGRGDPARAPESVQDRLALKLYRQRGSAPWGACADA